MRRTKEDAELTRQALLKAAIKVFSKQGYAATRLEDIAKTAGVTRGAVYHHFGGKSELFAEIIENAAQTGDRAIQRAIQKGGTFLEIIERILFYTLQLLADDGEYKTSLALLLFNAWGSPELLPMNARRLAQDMAQLEQIAGFFRAAHAQGKIRADIDPDVAARAFVAYQNGLVLLHLAVPGALSVEQHAQGLAKTFVQGIAPR